MVCIWFYFTYYHYDEIECKKIILNDIKKFVVDVKESDIDYLVKANERFQMTGECIIVIDEYKLTKYISNKTIKHS